MILKKKNRLVRCFVIPALLSNMSDRDIQAVEGKWEKSGFIGSERLVYFYRPICGRSRFHAVF